MASRVWNMKLDAVLNQIGYTRSKVDPCIYYKIKNEKTIIVAVYVDDFLIFSNCIQLKENLKSELNQRFKIKDLGEAKSCLGLNITRDRNQHKIWVDQERYITGVLERFHMENCNSVSTPSDPNQKLSKDMSPKNAVEFKAMENVPYQQAVGSILYAAQGTRPDITSAVHMVSRFNNNPGKAHWNAVKRILRYLKGTASAKLEFCKEGNPELLAYCDSDWASDVDERRSVTGYIFMMQGGPISWNSRKQQTVALSTTEAEYMALSVTTQEAMWLKNLENEFQLNSSATIKILCDNRSAIVLSSNNVYHARTKHIDIRHHYVREKVDAHQTEIVSIGTNDMIADVLTKSLSSNKHIKCFKGMGLIIK